MITPSWLRGWKFEVHWCLGFHKKTYVLYAGSSWMYNTMHFSIHDSSSPGMLLIKPKLVTMFWNYILHDCSHLESLQCLQKTLDWDGIVAIHCGFVWCNLIGHHWSNESISFDATSIICSGGCNSISLHEKTQLLIALGNFWYIFSPFITGRQFFFYLVFLVCYSYGNSVFVTISLS